MELALKTFNMKTCAWVADQIESQFGVKNIEKFDIKKKKNIDIKTNVNLYPHSVKMHTSDKQFILGNRTSN